MGKKDNENSDNSEVGSSKEDKKGKSKKTKYTIKEIQTILKIVTMKNYSLREAAKKFNVPSSTIFGWIQKRKYYFSNIYKNQFNPRGRKSDSFEYDKILLNFIKEGRGYDIAITSSEVICKAMEIIPGFNMKTYNSLHHWFKRFREKYSFPIRKMFKTSQSLPKNFLDNLRNHLYNAIKDVVEYNTDVKSSFLANVSEIPIILDPKVETRYEKVDDSVVKIRIYGKAKQRLSCFLCIYADGHRAPPMLVFKGMEDDTFEKRLNNLNVVKENKVFVVCQEDPWFDDKTFIKWLNFIWFRAYSFRNIKDSILYFDRHASHLTNDIKKMFDQNNCFYRLIPPGLTSYCQPLDLCANKIFKDSIQNKYREFCVRVRNMKKPTPEDLIEWVSEIWWSNTISISNIKLSFKVGGINLKMDGSEDSMFQWPTTPDMVLVEDVPELSKKNDNEMNLDFSETSKKEKIEEDIPFDTKIYNINSIRNDVMNALRNKDKLTEDYGDVIKNLSNKRAEMIAYNNEIANIANENDEE